MWRPEIGDYRVPNAAPPLLGLVEIEVAGSPLTCGELVAVRQLFDELQRTTITIRTFRLVESSVPKDHSIRRVGMNFDVIHFHMDGDFVPGRVCSLHGDKVGRGNIRRKG